MLLAVAAFGTIQGAGILTTIRLGYDAASEFMISGVYLSASGLLVFVAVLPFFGWRSSRKYLVIAALAFLVALTPCWLLWRHLVIGDLFSVRLAVVAWVPAAVFAVGSWWYFFSLWMRRRQSRQTPEQGYVQ
jgi:hypothetical protein